MTTTNTDITPTIITRTGQPPLKFTGITLGIGTTRDHNSTRWTTVTIYKTKGGKYVSKVCNMTQWQGERDFTEAKSFATAAELIESLRGDGGRLGRASQQALERAAEEDENFGAAYVEEVE